MNTRARKRTLLAIFGGDLVEDASGKWRTTTAKDPGDQYGILWDRLRVEAGWALYRDDQQLCLVVLGGKSDKPGAPLIATVMKQELMELGVPEEAIVTEEESTTTYQQLLGLQQMVQEQAGDHVLILTNAYHLPRVQAMIADGPKLSTLKDLFAVGQLTVQAAEEILVERDPETWHGEIDTVYQREAMQARINGEANGVRQIHQGPIGSGKQASPVLADTECNRHSFPLREGVDCRGRHSHDPSPCQCSGSSVPDGKPVIRRVICRRWGLL